MSYWASDTLLRNWATANLKRFLDPREYTIIFDRLHAEKRSERLSRVEIGLLKIMLDDYRPERGEQEQRAYAESNAVSLPEIADTLRCHVTTVRKAKKRLNAFAKQSQRQVRSDGHGLILFHDLGVCIRATFWDAMRARDYSEAQTTGQMAAHSNNIGLSDEKKHGLRVEQENLARFAQLTPIEQARLLSQLNAAQA